jgi:hypothetical protein
MISFTRDLNSLDLAAFFCRMRFLFVFLSKFFICPAKAVLVVKHCVSVTLQGWILKTTYELLMIIIWAWVPYLLSDKVLIDRHYCTSGTRLNDCKIF